MTDQVDQEIKAIQAVLSALIPLSPKARQSVIEYVSKRLDMVPPTEVSTAPPVLSALPPTPATPEPAQVTHIEQLKERKKPRSANEMAALVAYYVSHLAPPADRKDTINTKDTETYFKIAKFKLPRQIRVTLQNAKNAGYLDMAGDGEYKLNPVGYNLVVHSMPRGSSKSSPQATRGSRTTKKKAKSRRKTRSTSKRR